jgi:hypothetical protein
VNPQQSKSLALQGFAQRPPGRYLPDETTASFCGGFAESYGGAGLTAL